MKRIILSITAVFVGTVSFAQALAGSYFFENSYERGKLNPAFAPRGTRFSLPGLGGLGVSVASNLGLDNIVFQNDGKSYYFLNDNVSLDEFEGNLPMNPYLSTSFNTDLFDFGFRLSPISYLTISASANVNAGVNLPKDLFVFLKNGTGGGAASYDMAGMNAYADAYADLSVGYQRDLSDLVPGLSAGIRLKGLVGLASISADINKCNVGMSGEQWTVTTDAVAVINLKGLDVSSSEDGIKTDYEMELSPSGFGAGIDFGVEYCLPLDIPVISGIRASAAINDLGFISYNSGCQNRLVSSGSATFDGIKDVNTDTDFGDALQDKLDEFTDIVDFESAEAEKYSYKLSPRIFIGAEVRMLKDYIGLGALYSRIYGESRLTGSLNFRPFKCLCIGFNATAFDAGKGVGSYLEFCPKAGIGFFFGTDCVSARFSPQMIPVDSATLALRFGGSFLFGSKHLKK